MQANSRSMPYFNSIYNYIDLGKIAFRAGKDRDPGDLHGL